VSGKIIMQNHKGQFWNEQGAPEKNGGTGEPGAWGNVAYSGRGTLDSPRMHFQKGEAGGLGDGEANKNKENTWCGEKTRVYEEDTATMGNRNLDINKKKGF